MSEIVFKDVQEQARTYHFPDGKLRIERVVRIAIPGTTHRLETADGKKYIVRCGWHAIELEMEGWTL